MSKVNTLPLCVEIKLTEYSNPGIDKTMNKYQKKSNVKAHVLKTNNNKKS